MSQVTMPRIELIGGASPAIHLHRNDGRIIPVHPLWLRERCQSPASIDQRTGQRLYNPSEIDPQLRITALRRHKPDHLTISFSDGHESEFSDAEILTEAGMAPETDGLPAPLAWNAQLDPLPEVHWGIEGQEGLSNAALLDITGKFLRYGFVILHGVPRVSQALFRVAETFGFVRDTNFGRFFDVRSVPDANDLAYSSLALDPHVDNPYREPSPGIQLLHCLVN
jgi:gamma-butyrobetaine dioxygenase